MLMARHYETELTPIMLAVLAGIVKDKQATDAKRSLQPGSQNVEATFHVRANLTKLADTEGVIAQKAEPWKLLAVALNRLNGVTIDSIVREAEALKDEEIEALKEKTAEALNTIKGKTTGRISGKTTVSVEVLELVS